MINFASDNLEAIERFHAALGRAISRCAAAAEQAAAAPLSPQGYVQLLGQCVILERMTVGVLVPIDLMREFFGPGDPVSRANEADPSLPITLEQFTASIQGILDGLSGRLREWGELESAPATISPGDAAPAA